ncbi:hypothetical protein HY450_02860 [Candidatus Pacearchaeota archaeon]|nr:hypothetical protein [Candidatus Pacearchaeota archaeon]
MEYPILLYGINLGLIPEERRKLSSEVIMEDEIANPKELEKIVSDAKLSLLLIGEGHHGVLSDDIGYEFKEVKIGILIRSNSDFYGGVGGNESFFNSDDEGLVFDLNQILELKQNPSELISKFRKLGLDVKPEELYLYGTTNID